MLCGSAADTLRIKLLIISLPLLLWQAAHRQIHLSPRAGPQALGERILVKNVVHEPCPCLQPVFLTLIFQQSDFPT